jgi:hypothetical protein
MSNLGSLLSIFEFFCIQKLDDFDSEHQHFWFTFQKPQNYKRNSKKLLLVTLKIINVAKSQNFVLQLQKKNQNFSKFSKFFLLFKFGQIKKILLHIYKLSDNSTPKSFS